MESLVIIFSFLVYFISFYLSDNAIDDEAFHLLDPDTIKDLIPSVGPRLKFLKHFKAFRGADQPAADNDFDVMCFVKRFVLCILPTSKLLFGGVSPR